ncbi:hypothetical protein BJ741DRAFT_606607 [Chytriomyces cf. hyalinus JEL632]|nr:hypothetical protein BJ741DRAFT_606607 [Chytriomyces cf. hyalinus JEL632]
MVFTLVVHLYAKDDAAAIATLNNLLLEASQVYIKDAGTLNWYIMQDSKDKRAFTIVERYEQESSLQIHAANPFYKHFGATAGPLLDKPLEIRRFNEIDGKL